MRPPTSSRMRGGSSGVGFPVASWECPNRQERIWGSTRTPFRPNCKQTVRFRVLTPPSAWRIIMGVRAELGGLPLTPASGGRRCFIPYPAPPVASQQRPVLSIPRWQATSKRKGVARDLPWPGGHPLAPPRGPRVRAWGGLAQGERRCTRRRVARTTPFQVRRSLDATHMRSACAGQMTGPAEQGRKGEEP